MKTQPIAILCDSTCDIPQPLVDQYDIKIIPQYVIWGEKQFRDRIDLTPHEFYERLVSDPIYPSSAQATAMDFSKAYQAAKDEGAKEIIVLTVSGAMSGTIQSARTAAENSPIPVYPVDAHGPTMSLGWQVLAAARAREAGQSVEQILNRIEQVRGRLVQFVAMESMEYLYKGGRIGNAKHLLGSLLNIKPLVWIDHVSGLVEASGMARTHKALVEMLIAKFFEKLGEVKNLRIAVLHGDVLEEAEALAERIRRDYNPLELVINITGPVLGINTGPRALALCGYCED